MSDNKPVARISPHVEVEIWRLQQLQKQVSDPVLMKRIERLASGMLPGQTIWISGELFQAFESAANAPKAETASQIQENGNQEPDEDV